MSVNIEIKKKIEELISEAFEYDVLTEDEDLGGIIFEDELISKNNKELLNLLMVDRDLLSRIDEALNEAKADEDEDSDDEKDFDDGDED